MEAFSVRQRSMDEEYCEITILILVIILLVFIVLRSWLEVAGKVDRGSLACAFHGELYGDIITEHHGYKLQRSWRNCENKNKIMHHFAIVLSPRAKTYTWRIDLM